MKMYCVFSKEAIMKMGGNRGKMAAQAGHAFLGAWIDAYQHNDPRAKDYAAYGAATKITLVVNTEHDLVPIYGNYVQDNGCHLVIDAAHTVLPEPMVTCLGIGPLRDEEIGDDLKALKPLI
jgi:peptidyl-tRNA hydrolase